jgi:beta-lactamase class A
MRLRSLLLVVALVAAGLATVGSAAAADPAGVERFADVDPTRFYGEAVEWAHAQGVVTGVTDECFAPARSATRAEVAAVLQRLVAPDSTVTGHPFVDVAAQWQQTPIAWMADLGITTGTAPTLFSPDQPATRAMVGTFLWRIEGRPTPEGPTHGFTDVDARWQQEPVAWMAANGITVGRAPSRFAPDDPVTRGELMTFVWRWQGEPGTTSALLDAPMVDCRVATRTCADVFSATATAEIGVLAAGRRVTAHVHDHRTGCVYELGAGLEITTASVIKAQILAGVLLDAQDRGVPVSPDDEARIELMMRFSHNSPPTSALYARVGGAAGMEALDRRFGITGTSHTGLYGATVSTAADRTRLVEQLLIGGGPLDDRHVADAWEWMSAVSAAQSWGLSAGLPVGHEFALKNGFYPLSGRGWRVGTSGAVRTPNGGAYAITILSDGNGDEQSGIDLVEAVARHVNEELTVGEPAARAVDEVRCATAGSGNTWAEAGSMLGVDDLESLRRINGGESAPLRGQRVCAP